MLSNTHNLVSPPVDAEKHYGIRVTMIGTDPLRNLLGDDWEKFHWFVDAAERDAVLKDMLRRHQFSRLGDRPTINCEPIER